MLVVQDRHRLKNHRPAKYKFYVSLLLYPFDVPVLSPPSLSTALVAILAVSLFISPLKNLTFIS